MRKSWTEQMIAEELTKVTRDTGTMVTFSFLKDIGRYDLANAITRNGGWTQWSHRLGLSKEGSTCQTGWDGEIALCNSFQEKGLQCERMDRVKSPYDLLVSEHVKIDVKSAKYAEYGVCRGWFYRLGKHVQADILAFYQLDTGDCYFVPWHSCPITSVTISRSGGKYKDFKNRYDIIEKIAAFRETEKTLWPTPDP